MNCREEFYQIIGPLLEESQVQQMDQYLQHGCYTRLRHCMDVAYLGFFWARLLQLDSTSVARAGLLHDLFFHSEGQNRSSLLFSHPKIALENARKICILNKIEEDAILKHMWLLTPMFPRYRESYVVSLADKYCASREFVLGVFRRASVRVALVSSMG